LARYRSTSDLPPPGLASPDGREGGHRVPFKPGRGHIVGTGTGG
jgi:hypothetical protein